MPSENEIRFFNSIRERVAALRQYLVANPEPGEDNAAGWYSYLSEFKSLQGNPNNDISFIATYMAKEYLSIHYEIEFDAAEKPQGASGLDIDVISKTGERIVAEIKTTYPYKKNDLGAQQANTFKKDFRKLDESEAAHKFFFLTESRAFELMKKPKYQKFLVGIKTVLLPGGTMIVG